MSNEKRPNTLLSYNFSSKKSEFDVYLIKIISFHFFVFIKNLISFFYVFVTLLVLCWAKKSFGLSIKILPILPIVFSRYKRSLPIGLKILVTPLIAFDSIERILSSDNFCMISYVMFRW